MPDHLRVNPKRHYCQPEKDEEIGWPEGCRMLERHGVLSLGCGRPTSFSLLRCSFAHAVCETTRPRTIGQPTRGMSLIRGKNWPIAPLHLAAGKEMPNDPGDSPTLAYRTFRCCSYRSCHNDALLNPLKWSRLA